LQGLLRSGAIAVASGAPWRISFQMRVKALHLFYTQHVDCSVAQEHAVSRYLKIASALGCEDGPVVFPFAVDDSDRMKIAQLLPEMFAMRFFYPEQIGNPSAGLLNHFAALVVPIRKRFGLECVVAGGSSDSTLAQSNRRKIRSTGKTNLREMVALLERADLVIANVASATGWLAHMTRPMADSILRRYASGPCHWQ